MDDLTYKGKVSKFQIDQLVCGLLSAEERAVIEKEISGCPLSQEYLKQAEEVKSGLASAKMRVKQNVMTDAMTSGKKSAFRMIWLPQFAMVGLALLVTFLVIQPDDNINFKSSGSEVEIFAKRSQSGQIEKWNQTLFPGDAIRYQVKSQSPYLLVISVQDNGVVNNFLPSQAEQSIPISASQPLDLAGSMVVDDYSGEEFLVFIFSSKAVPFKLLKEQRLPVKRGQLKEQLHQYAIDEVVSLKINKVLK